MTEYRNRKNLPLPSTSTLSRSTGHLASPAHRCRIVARGLCVPLRRRQPHPHSHLHLLLSSSHFPLFPLPPLLFDRSLHGSHGANFLLSPLHECQTSLIDFSLYPPQFFSRPTNKGPSARSTLFLLRSMDGARESPAQPPQPRSEQSSNPNYPNSTVRRSSRLSISTTAADLSSTASSRGKRRVTIEEASLLPTDRK